MEPVSNRGQIITFYSYKGGTGRTMAIANLACLFAQSYSKRVLIIDWDLEAPGLHRYFPNRLAKKGPAKNKERPEEGGPGLIEMMMELRKLVVADVPDDSNPATENQTESSAAACVAKIDLPRFFNSTEIKGLFIMRAGAFDDSYSRHINTFPWEELYRRSPWLFTALANKLSELFDYVLIDSRTGLTDTSGICTMILPQTLVTVFTPNRQSFLGALQIAEKAANYRRKSSDERPLLIMPLVSRVEAAKPELRDKWRFGEGDEWVGFQPGFENLFKRIYDLDDLTLKVYFDRIQLKHVPDYAYGEPIAVLIEKSDDLHSLRGVYSEFCARLVEGVAPWDLADEASVLNVQRDVAEKRAEAAELSAKETKRTLTLVSIGFAVLILIFVAFVALRAWRNHTASTSTSSPTDSVASQSHSEAPLVDGSSKGDENAPPHLSPTVPEAVPLAQLHANEDSAIKSMLEIGQAEIGYLKENNARTCLKLSELGPAPKGANKQGTLDYADLIDERLASGTKSGYSFHLTCARVQPSKNPSSFWYRFEATATPAKPYSGYRRFCIMEDGVVREFKGSEMCLQADPLPNVRTQGLSMYANP